MHMLLTERLLAWTMIARSKKVLGWQLGAEKSREHDSPVKGPGFLKFIREVTSPREL